LIFRFLRRARSTRSNSGEGENGFVIDLEPAQDHLAPRKYSRDRIISSNIDPAVVQQKEVRDAAKPPDSFAVFIANRLIGDVAAGQHNRAAGAFKQETVQRRVGKHESKGSPGGRYRLGDSRIGVPVEQHNRAALRE